MSTQCITEHNGRLWFSSSDGLQSLDLQNLVSRKESTVIPICFLSLAGMEKPWYGTRQGIYVPDKNTPKTLEVISTISGCISCLTQDSQGSIWYAKENALSRLVINVDGNFQYSRSYCPSKKRIINLLQDIDDTIWCATEDGLFVYQAGIDEFSRVSSAAITNLTQGYSKNLYLATVTGFSRIEGSNRAMIDNWCVGIPYGATHQCVVDDASGRLFLGFAEGLCIREGKESKLVKFIETGVSIQCLFPDSQGQVWCGTNLGLFLVEGYEAVSVKKLASPRNRESSSGLHSFTVAKNANRLVDSETNALEDEIKKLREENRILKEENSRYGKILEEQKLLKKTQLEWSEIHKANQREVSSLRAALEVASNALGKGSTSEFEELSNYSQSLQKQVIDSKSEVDKWKKEYTELLDAYQQIYTQMEELKASLSLSQEPSSLSAVEVFAESPSVEDEPQIILSQASKIVTISPLIKNLLSTYNAILSRFSENADRKAELENRFTTGIMRVSVSNIQDVDGGDPPQLRESERATFYLVQDDNAYLALPIPAMASMRSSYMREMYHINGDGAFIIRVDHIALFQKQGNAWCLVQKGEIVVGNA